jgi:hypothetical protein
VESPPESLAASMETERDSLDPLVDAERDFMGINITIYKQL